jgi:hypothetical protein
MTHKTTHEWQKLPQNPSGDEILSALSVYGYGEESAPNDILPLEEERDDLYILAEGRLEETLRNTFLSFAGLPPDTAPPTDDLGISQLQENMEESLPESLKLHTALIEADKISYILATREALEYLKIDISNVPEFAGFPGNTKSEPPLAHPYDLNTGQ